MGGFGGGKCKLGGEMVDFEGGKSGEGRLVFEGVLGGWLMIGWVRVGDEKVWGGGFVGDT